MIKHKYLGDGAYIRMDSGVFTIYTSDGKTEANHVILEKPEIDNLIDFLKECYGVKQLV